MVVLLKEGHKDVRQSAARSPDLPIYIHAVPTSIDHGLSQCVSTGTHFSAASVQTCSDSSDLNIAFAEFVNRLNAYE